MIVNFRKKIREYHPIDLKEEVKSKAFFLLDKKLIECSFYHLLYDPCIVGISFSQEYSKNEIKEGVVKLFSFGESLTAELKLVLSRVVSLDNEFLFLFTIIDAKLYLSLIEKLLVRRMFNTSQKTNNNFIENFNFLTYKKFVGIFSLPKRVSLISIFSNEKYHHFPLDLYSQIGEFIVLGVRRTNAMIKTLKIGDLFYVGNVNGSKYLEIYNLGKFLKENNTGVKKVESLTIMPDLVSSYSKVSLVDVIDYGSQKLYISRVVTRETRNSQGELYHIHKIWYLKYSSFFKNKH